jgi:uncharacterized protein (DUF2141 family)
MFKLFARTALFATGIVVLVQPGSALAALGPDAASCRAGASGPAMLVTVDGFKARTGNIRVNVYGSDPRKFLARGQYVRQINVPVTRAGAMPICVAVPRTGSYAVAVRHDVDGDGNDWGDGGGFSRNPRLSLTSLRPRYQNVAINVGQGVLGLSVILNYRFGLSVRPVRA